MESTPMLTLEEAVAEYKALWNRYTYTGDTPPENSPLINVVRREEVDAAVRNVALAAAEVAGRHQTPHLHVNAFVSKEETTCPLCDLLDKLDAAFRKEDSPHG